MYNIFVCILMVLFCKASLMGLDTLARRAERQAREWAKANSYHPVGVIVKDLD